MRKLIAEITYEDEVTKERVEDAVEQGLESAAANIAPFSFFVYEPVDVDEMLADECRRGQCMHETH